MSIELRYLLTDLIHQQPERHWKVAELVDDLTAAGIDLYERPNKYVSDLLRTEVNRGRVIRRGWGRYSAGRMPGSTARRIRKRARRARDEARAEARHAWAATEEVT